MKIFLIGFMGSGKSHWGRIWASHSGMSFYDLDKMIEEGEGKTIAEIFRSSGESHFRELETRYLSSFSSKPTFILACGGGVPCFNNNMEWMNAHGTTVYLKVSPAILVQRIMDDKTDRPLITEKDPGKLIEFIEAMLSKREQFYSQAKIILTESDVRCLPDIRHLK